MPANDPVRFGKAMDIESHRLADGSNAAVVKNGVYLYQQWSDTNSLLELRADKAVLFYHEDHLSGAFSSPDPNAEAMPVLPGAMLSPNPKPIEEDPNEALKPPRTLGVYLEGNVTLLVNRYYFVEDIRITAESLYYDYSLKRAVILDADFSMLLPGRGDQIEDIYAEDIWEKLPLHLRAKRLRTWSFDRIEAAGVQISNDEFSQPFIWLGAEDITVNRTQTDPQTQEQAADGNRYHLRMNHVTLNIDKIPVFWWPRAAASTTDTEIPLESVQLGYDSEFGGSVETEWDLAWLLGLREPESIDSSLLLDGFTRRGPAAGVDSDYKTDTMFGRFRSYLVHDQGEDQLGRTESRNNVNVDDYFRGRARWQHRQYLPQDWQATFELSYLSDRNFLESWREREFDTDKEQESLIYFQKRKDNWAFDFISKSHINNFDYTVTEQPGISLHGAGQNLPGGFSYYHDSSITRLSEQAGDRLAADLAAGRETPSPLPDSIAKNNFAFLTSRHEIAWPLLWQNIHVTPTFIGVYVHDDSALEPGDGAFPWQNDPRYMDKRSENDFFQGAAGLRLSTQFWHIDNSVQSNLFDLDRLRHIVSPEVNLFWQNSTLEETPRHDIFNVGLRQRWQTKRGYGPKKYSTDVLRLNTFATFVTNDVEEAALPGRFIYQQPEWQFDHPAILNHDLAGLGLARRSQYNQSLSDYFTTDITWFASPTTVLSGGINYNLYDEAVSHLYSDLYVQRSELTQYHIGHSFWRKGDPFNDADAHFFTAGISYYINTKYSVVLNQQFDIANDAAAYTRGSIIRKHRHWYSAVTLGYDATRNGTSVVFSIWPAGFNELFESPRRFTRLAP